MHLCGGGWGLLFGYDTAVVAGAIGFIQTKYALSPL